jgi:hypothetical protein
MTNLGVTRFSAATLDSMILCRSGEALIKQKNFKGAVHEPDSTI